MYQIALAIFAKHGTNEKVLVPCFNNMIPDTMEILNKQFGPDWIYIEVLRPGEALKFTDDLKYLGFHGRDERYSSAIFTAETALSIPFTHSSKKRFG